MAMFMLYKKLRKKIKVSPFPQKYPSSETPPGVGCIKCRTHKSGNFRKFQSQILCLSISSAQNCTNSGGSLFDSKQKPARKSRILGHFEFRWNLWVPDTENVESIK
ncbi:hypothetical protein JTE90_022234 [Oedothorax gibbosus]|uniref:Uncharacterized protein n=1 Tax=Oedothorax gibbosus TaxID=931172 RepID=A0AAV6VXQ3_9ARAC|nr:hypothetical protein JTE90_022234 [Oedothorax gibbosus]